MTLVRWALAVLAICCAAARADEPLTWPASARDRAGWFFYGRARLAGGRLEFTPEESSRPGAPAWSWDDFASLAWPHVRGASAAPEAESLILSAWGDLLPGRILRLDEREAVVRWAWGGEATVPRAALAGLAAPPGRRLEHRISFDTSDQPRRQTFVDAIPAGEASFVAAETSPGKEGASDDSDDGEVVALRFGEVTVRVHREATARGRVWTLHGGENVVRERPAVTPGESRLHLQWDRDWLTMDVDGQRAATADIRSAGATGLVAGASVRELSVYRSHAPLPPLRRLDADRDLLQLDDGEMLRGTIVGLEGGRWRIRTPLGEASVEATRTSGVLFRRQTTELAFPGTVLEVPLRLPSQWSDFALDRRRSRVAGSLGEVTERGIQLQHPAFGSLVVPFGWTAGVDVASRDGLQIVAGGPFHLDERASSDAVPVSPDGRRIELRFALPAAVGPTALVQVESLDARGLADPASLTVKLDGQTLAAAPSPHDGFEWLTYALPAAVSAGEHRLELALPAGAKEPASACIGTVRVVTPKARAAKP